MILRRCSLWKNTTVIIVTVAVTINVAVTIIALDIVFPRRYYWSVKTTAAIAIALATTVILCVHFLFFFNYSEKLLSLYY